MLLRPFDRRILTAIAELGGNSYAPAIRVQAKRWRTPSFGSVYAALERLEKSGLVQRRPGQVRYPERGGRIRYYYRIVS